MSGARPGQLARELQEVAPSTIGGHDLQEDGRTCLELQGALLGLAGVGPVDEEEEASGLIQDPDEAVAMGKVQVEDDPEQLIRTGHEPEDVECISADGRGDLTANMNGATRRKDSKVLGRAQLVIGFALVKLLGVVVLDPSEETAVRSKARAYHLFEGKARPLIDLRLLVLDDLEQDLGLQVPRSQLHGRGRQDQDVMALQRATRDDERDEQRLVQRIGELNRQLQDGAILIARDLGTAELDGGLLGSTGVIAGNGRSITRAASQSEESEE